MTPAETFVRAARLLLPVREAGANTGRFVEAIQRFGGGTPGQPWCAYFVHYVGRKLFDAAWPLPRTGSCDVLLEHARKARALYDASARPAPGWLFLILKSATDAVHVGIVDTVLPDGRFVTVEGNSNDRGVRDGDGVVSNTRDPRGATTYAFIDLPALLDARPSSPTAPAV